MAARIVVNVEIILVRRDVQTGLFSDPGHDFLEHWSQKLLIKVAIIAQRRVQVFGKTVGLKVAFLQAGAALEDPAVRKLLMGIDASQYPAQNVVFFDNTG